MKFIKTLSFLIFSIFLLSGVSAVIFDAEWNDGSNIATIINGQSVNLNIPDGGSISPPTTMEINLNSKTIYTKIINDIVFSFSYTIKPSDYNSQPGTYTIDIIGTDNLGKWYETLYLTVIPSQPANLPPTITSIPNQQINEGMSYSYQVLASDPENNLLTYSLTGAPTGFTINSNGLITGIAPPVNTNTNYNIIIGVSDGVNFVTQSYTLTILDVLPTNQAPEITSSPVTSVIEGNYYEYDVDAIDNDGDILTYNIMDTHGWLHINSNTGLISGTAPQVSSSTDYTITVEVSDNKGGTDTQTYTLRVKNYIYGSSQGTSRVISDYNDIYYQNKYYDQFNRDKIVYRENAKPEPQTPIIFYIILAIVSLGIIIVVFILFRYIRR